MASELARNPEPYTFQVQRPISLTGWCEDLPAGTYQLSVQLSLTCNGMQPCFSDVGLGANDLAGYLEVEEVR